MGMAPLSIRQPARSAPEEPGSYSWNCRHRRGCDLRVGSGKPWGASISGREKKPRAAPIDERATGAGGPYLLRRRNGRMLSQDWRHIVARRRARRGCL